MWQIVARHGNYRGKSWIIGEQGLLLGRGAHCGVIIKDPLVSREHCRMFLQDGELYFQDTGSRNATLVNGQPRKQGILRPGDHVALGNAQFLVACAVQEAEPGTGSGLTKTTRLLRGAKASHATMWETDAAPGTVEELAALHDLALALGANLELDGIAQAVAKQMACFRTVVHCALALPDSAHTPAQWIPPLPLEEGGLLGAIETRLDSDGAQAPQLVRDRAGNLLQLDQPPVLFAGIPIARLCLLLRNSPPHHEPDPLGLCAARLIAPYVKLALSQRNASTAADPVPSAIIGTSPEIDAVRMLVSQVARAELPVLLQGETGTGKELLATLIHRLSPRSEKPFVPVNCAALTDSLLESEFFGHVKGAFTGATVATRGLMAEADGGILFLDEIGDLSPLGQSCLLRAIETGTYRPVGSARESRSDVWIIAASNKHLFSAVQQGRFRADLYYRLMGVEITLPPLRDRRVDIPALIDHFSAEYTLEKGPTPRVFSVNEKILLSALPWLGNVRELRNTVRRLLAFPGEPIPVLQQAPFSPPLAPPDVAMPDYHENERARVLQALQRTGGRIQDAAGLLGIHRNTLSKRLRRLGLPRK